MTTVRKRDWLIAGGAAVGFGVLLAWTSQEKPDCVARCQRNLLVLREACTSYIVNNHGGGAFLPDDTASAFIEKIRPYVTDTSALWCPCAKGEQKSSSYIGPASNANAIGDKDPIIRDKPRNHGGRRLCAILKDGTLVEIEDSTVPP